MSRRPQPLPPLTVKPADSWRLLLGLGAASGLLLWLATLSKSSSWMAWIGLVPLGVLAQRTADRRRIYLGAWLGGLCFFVPGVAWVRLSDPSAWLGWLLLALYLSLFFPACVLLIRILHRRWQVPLLFAIPIVWTAGEYVRMHALTGFGWLMLAHAIFTWTYWIQLADVGGAYAVSFVIAWFNAWLVELLTLPWFVPAAPGQRPRPNPSLRWRTPLTAAVMIGTVMYGWQRVREYDPVEGPTLLLAHSTLPQSLKLNDAEQSLEHYRKLTGKLQSAKGDLFVWPETSYTYEYGTIDPSLSDLEISRLKRRRSGNKGHDPSAKHGEELRNGLQIADQELTAIAQQVKMPFLVGVVDYEFKPESVKRYNASVLFDPEKGRVDYYHKRHLVPFGEYLPLQDWLPVLRRLMPFEEGADIGLDPTSDAKSIHWNDLHFGSLICFEDTLPHLALDLVRTADPPIEFLINQSNDGWFAGSNEPRQHLASAVFRCVETRLPMGRSTNLGMTSVIDSLGRTIDVTTQITTPGGIRRKLPLDERIPYYVFWGDWLPILCVSMTATGMFMSIVRHLWRLRRRPLPGPTS